MATLIILFNNIAIEYTFACFFQACQMEETTQPLISK